MAGKEWKCQKCGTVNMQDAAYCYECGSQANEKSKTDITKQKEPEFPFIPYTKKDQFKDGLNNFKDNVGKGTRAIIRGIGYLAVIFVIGVFVYDGLVGRHKRAAEEAKMKETQQKREAEQRAEQWLREEQAKVARGSVDTNRIEQKEAARRESDNVLACGSSSLKQTVCKHIAVTPGSIRSKMTQFITDSLIESSMYGNGSMDSASAKIDRYIKDDTLWADAEIRDVITIAQYNRNLSCKGTYVVGGKYKYPLMYIVEITDEGNALLKVY